MSSTPYNWELLTEHAAFSPRDTSEANIDKRNLLWQRGLRFFVLRQHRFVHAMCILTTRKSHGVQHWKPRRAVRLGEPWHTRSLSDPGPRAGSTPALLTCPHLCIHTQS